MAMLILLCICLVITAEIFNTAIEHMRPNFHPDISPEIKINQRYKRSSSFISGFHVNFHWLYHFLTKNISEHIFYMNKYENDLTHIRQMMERSSTFISLSGLSGVGAGLVALAGCALTFYILGQYHIDYFDGKPNYYSYEVIIQLAIVAITTLVLAIASGIYFTVKKSKKLGIHYGQQRPEIRSKQPLFR
jgi:hypothetical protein